ALNSLGLGRYDFCSHQFDVRRFRTAIFFANQQIPGAKLCHFGHSTVPDVESHLDSAPDSAFFLFTVSIIASYSDQDGYCDSATSLKSGLYAKQFADVELILLWRELWLCALLSGKFIQGK